MGRHFLVGRAECSRNIVGQCCQPARAPPAIPLPPSVAAVVHSGHVESGFVCGVFVGVPTGDDAGSEHLVGESCEAVSGVGVEGELHVLVCFGSSAFPSVDVADGGEDGCCVLWAGSGVGVDEQLLCHSTRDHLGAVWVGAKTMCWGGSSMPGMSAMSRSRMWGGIGSSR